MKFKVLIPDNPLFDYFVSGQSLAETLHELEILRLPEKNISELMLANRADAAVLSPIGYGMGLIKSDYRIIKSHILALENFTDRASIYFKSGLKTFSSLASNRPDDFITHIAKILLSEMYDMSVNILPSVESNEIIREKYDSSVLWGSSGNSINTLDLSEEWFNLYEIELPVAFWVCRNQEHFEIIETLVRDLSTGAQSLDEDVSELTGPDSAEYGREGRIIRNWNENSENAIDCALHLLYFHQYFPELPAIKILGRD